MSCQQLHLGYIASCFCVFVLLTNHVWYFYLCAWFLIHVFTLAPPPHTTHTHNTTYLLEQLHVHTVLNYETWNSTPRTNIICYCVVSRRTDWPICRQDQMFSNKKHEAHVTVWRGKWCPNVMQKMQKSVRLCAANVESGKHTAQIQSTQLTCRNYNNDEEIPSKVPDTFYGKHRCSRLWLPRTDAASGTVWS